MLPLVCIDVDGTLVGATGAPTVGVWRAAEAAIARGQHLALCTARGAFGATWGYACRLDPNGWHLFHAGASLVHTGTGEVDHQRLTPAEVADLIALGRDRGWVTEVYSDRTYVVDDDRPLAVAHAALIGVPFERRPLEALDGEVVRVQFVVTAGEVNVVLGAVPPGLAGGSATSPIMPGAAFVSVTRDGVSKATAIARLADHLGIGTERVMMVGDGHNDIDAVRAVGFGVAMGNADPGLAEVADLHVGDVSDDGLVEALDLSATL